MIPIYNNTVLYDYVHTHLCSFLNIKDGSFGVDFLNQARAHFIKIISGKVCICTYLYTYLCPYALTHVSKPF